MADDPDLLDFLLPDGTGLTGFLIRRLGAVHIPAGRPRVIGIGGYPFTGKSLLAARLSRSWAGGSYVLQTESAIRSRAQRMSDGHDGSSTQAHSMETMERTVDLLMRGRSAHVNDYDWQVGDVTSRTWTPQLRPDGLLIIDGSIATAPPIVDLTDISVSFAPADKQEWMRRAVERDFQERAWPAHEAAVQNTLKAHTVDGQIKAHDRRPGHFAATIRSVSGDVWTVDLDGV